MAILSIWSVKRTAEVGLYITLPPPSPLSTHTHHAHIHAVQPVICKLDSVSEFKGCQKPQVTICWTIRQVPLTISYRHFVIRIYKEGDPQPDLLIQKEIDFEPTKERYEESFGVAELSDDTNRDAFLVVVEAKRVDGQTVCSENISLKTSKGIEHQYGFCFIDKSIIIREECRTTDTSTQKLCTK